MKPPGPEVHVTHVLFCPNGGHNGSELLMCYQGCAEQMSHKTRCECLLPGTEDWREVVCAVSPNPHDLLILTSAGVCEGGTHFTTTTGPWLLLAWGERWKSRQAVFKIIINHNEELILLIPHKHLVQHESGFACFSFTTANNKTCLTCCCNLDIYVFDQ